MQTGSLSPNRAPNDAPTTFDTSAAGPDGYDAYVRREWMLFARDPLRATASREATAGMRVRRVLDLGCGSGQELRPFVRDHGAFGIGLDLSPDVGRAGRELFAIDEPGSRVAFVRAAAEHLPFTTGQFDVVVCRLALPYTDNAQTISEIARVLAPWGRLLLRIHHVRYYLAELREGVAAGRIKAAVHASRVLLAGAWYHLTGRQPRGRITGRETFQTRWLLRRELRRHGLAVARVLPDTVPAAPSLLVTRAARDGSGSPEPLHDQRPSFHQRTS
jgi:SAM-dependent methyltransferase